MKILAIETSGASFSIALSDNGQVISEIFWFSGLKHSERLMPALENMFKEAGLSYNELNKIAVSKGPGSFTGIRVGLTCAKTLAHGLNVPLVGINTLEILASAVPSEGNYVIYPAIDALRREVYVLDKKNEVKIISVAELIKEIEKIDSKVILIGNSAKIYYDDFKKALKDKIIFAMKALNYPKAGVLALMAEKNKGLKYDKVKPLYIRRSWAEENRDSQLSKR